MNLPEDIPSTAPKPTFPLGNLVDEPAPITPQQRAADFIKTFVWRGKELIFSVASELYYRTLRMHMNAPVLGSYETLGDFTAEAPRVLYCASLTAKEIRVLQALPAEKQVDLHELWVQENILFHELLPAARLAREINEAIARALTQPMENEEEQLDGMGN